MIIFPPHLDHVITEEGTDRLRVLPVPSSSEEGDIIHLYILKCHRAGNLILDR